MLKISFIGAGSLVFGMNLLTDILTFPSLTKQDTIISLMDINEKKLDLIYGYMKNYQKKCPKDLNLEGVIFEKTTNQKIR